MVTVTAASMQLQRDSTITASKPVATAKAAAVAVVDSPEPATISTLASRLSKAAATTEQNNAGLDYGALKAKIDKNVIAINYPFEGAAKAAAEKQQPEPNDAASAKSAETATAYLNGKGSNPFAGLSREQLATISNDESGTFTVNEKRAAFRQAYDEEQVWRMQVVAQAQSEYSSSGKLTNFFQSVLDHYQQLPSLEQATYPENYAADLQAKVDLDFNYFNHSPGDAGPTPGSLADIFNANKSNSLFDLLEALTPKATKATKDD